MPAATTPQAPHPARSAGPSSRQRAEAGAVAGLGLAVVLWAGNFVIGRAIQGRIDPLDLNVWRWGVALLVLLPFTWAALRAQGPALRRHWRFVAALGLSGLAVPHVCIYQALQTTPTLNAVLWLNQAPLWVLAASWALGTERPRPAQWAGVAVATAGVLVLLARGDPQALLAMRWHGGDLWMLPALAGAVAHMLLLRRTPPGIAQGPLLTASALAALLWMAPAVVWRGGVAWPQEPPLWLAIAYVGVLASALAFWLWNRGVARVGPVRAAPMLLLMPLVGAALSAVWLGEPVAGHQALGAALIVGGLWCGRGRDRGVPPAVRPAGGS